MTELLQFSLMDMTPYDRRSWFNLIGDYNQAVWLAYPVALLLTLLLLRQVLAAKTAPSNALSVRIALAILGVGWCWTGAVFHMQHFANLNWAAPWFGWAFIAQGLLLFLAAVLMKSASWVLLASLRGRLALLLLLIGLVIYPLIGLLEGRHFIQLEWFPMLPTPMILVSVAVLMLLNTRWRHALVVIPVIWGVVSAAFALTLGLWEFYFIVGVGVFWVINFIL